MIRVWTIQPWDVWEQVKVQGALTVDPRYVANLHHCYDWLKEQLALRLPGYTGCYPWWAYCSRPDLRRERHKEPREERAVLIELGLPRNRVLTFPFWAWDLIFQGQFLSTSRRESERWHRRLRAAVPDEDEYYLRRVREAAPGEVVGILPEPWLTELELSWEQLFDPDFPDRGWSLGGEPRGETEREAVFEVLSRDCTRRVTPLLGTSRTARPREMQPE
jgi:hypothetical protein